jgi:hypothetical protein
MAMQAAVSLSPNASIRAPKSRKIRCASREFFRIYVVSLYLFRRDACLASLWSRDVRQQYLMAHQPPQLEELSNGPTKKFDTKPPKRAGGCDCKQVHAPLHSLTR